MGNLLSELGTFLDDLFQALGSVFSTPAAASTAAGNSGTAASSTASTTAAGLKPADATPAVSNTAPAATGTTVVESITVVDVTWESGKSVSISALEATATLNVSGVPAASSNGAAATAGSATTGSTASSGATTGAAAGTAASASAASSANDAAITSSNASASAAATASNTSAPSSSTVGTTAANDSSSASDQSHGYRHHHRRLGDAYGRQGDSLSQRLQGLISALGTDNGGSSSAIGGTLAKLQSDFQALVGAVNPAASASASAPTLSGFLQALATDLGAANGTSTSATGALVNATA